MNTSFMCFIQSVQEIRHYKYAGIWGFLHDYWILGKKRIQHGLSQQHSVSQELNPGLLRIALIIESNGITYFSTHLHAHLLRYSKGNGWCSYSARLRAGDNPSSLKAKWMSFSLSIIVILTCVHPISWRYCGICVVLPEPVCPTIITVWYFSTK